MQFKLKDYLNTLNVDKHQWYGWEKVEGDREVYAHLIVNHPEATKPTEQECIDGVIKMQADYDAQDYARKRLDEYPTIEECVHAILDDELDALQAKRKLVKDKYPKE